MTCDEAPDLTDFVRTNVGLDANAPCEERLYVDSEHRPIPHHQMTLWIDNEQVATRGYERLD